MWLVIEAIRCCKEQYCIGTWNFRSMNNGKLEVVKQEMARVNVDMLGISELKWIGIGEFNSDDHYIYCCGQESLRRNGIAIIVNKRVRNAVLGCNLKNNEWSLHFQGKPFNITVIQVYAPTSNAEEEAERFYENLQDLLKLIPKKDVLFIISGVISPLISCSILSIYQPGEFLFQYPIILPFHTVHGVLKARILKWFAIPFSTGPHSVRPLHHDLPVLGGPTRHGLVSLS